MNMFSAFNIAASGMTAQRYRMDIISENVANASTTRTEDGTPYVRKVVTFAQKGQQAAFGTILDNHLYDTNFHNNSFMNAYTDSLSGGITGGGVKVTGVYEDTETPMKMVYDPSHPDADEDGYVTMPNVNIVTEMTNMIDASRAFEANNTAFTAIKSMAMQGLQIGQN
jgi:flagellar basal-body rod protein FlgC